ncbi:MAG: hypothetical protein AB7K09_06710 [Planctomycetota bacterium]
MLCPKCRKDTPANQPYCVHCGDKIVVTRDAVFAQAQAQVEHEKEQYTARNIRSLLVYAVGFFLIALMLFIVTRNPPPPRPRPAWPTLNPPPEAQATSGQATRNDADNPAVPKTLIDMADADLFDDVPAFAPEAGDNGR